MNATNSETNEFTKKPEAYAGNLTKDLKKYSASAMDSVSEGFDATLAWVKKNPIQAAAVGAGLGFLIGAAVRRYTSKD